MARVTGHVFLVDRKSGPQWYAKYRVPPGKQVQKRLGPAHLGRGRCPAGSYTERTARDALEAILTDARRGTLENAARASGVTFADAAAEYVRFVRDVRKIDPTTIKGYVGVIDGYLLDEFGDMPVDAITPDCIDDYKEKLLAGWRRERGEDGTLAWVLREQPLSNRTIVRHLVVLNGIFKRAKRKRWVSDNPASAEMVERPPVVYTGEFDTYTRDEVELLAAHAKDAQDAAIIRTAAYTGLRQGELLALRWRDVDFVAGLLHVRRNYTDRRLKAPKGNKIGSVPMVADVADCLARLKDREHFTGDDDLVFVNAVGGFVDNWSLRKRYYQAIIKAGLRRVRFHDLRHAFGSMAIRKLDPHTVQTYMRHAHYSTTQRYLHHQPRPDHARLLSEAFAESSVSPVSGHARDTPGTDGAAQEGTDIAFSLQIKYPGRDSNPHGHEGPMAFEAIVSDQFHHPGGSRHMIWTMA
jgi:integrase